MSGQKKKTKKPKIPNHELILTSSEAEELKALFLRYPLVKKLYDIYISFAEDPSNEWLNTVNFCQREIRTLTINKTLDIMDDGYHKSLWEILKGGSTVAKTISSAKQEADISSTEEQTKGSDKEESVSVQVITAETAVKNV